MKMARFLNIFGFILAMSMGVESARADSPVVAPVRGSFRQVCGNPSVSESTLQSMWVLAKLVDTDLCQQAAERIERLNWLTLPRDFTDYRLLEGMDALDALTIESPHDTDFAPLAKLKSLRFLRIRGGVGASFDFL